MTFHCSLLCRSPLHSPQNPSEVNSSDDDSSIQAEAPPPNQTFPKNYGLLADTIERIGREMVRNGKNLRKVAKAKLKLHSRLQEEAISTIDNYPIRLVLNSGHKVFIETVVRLRMLYLLDPPPPDTTMMAVE